MCIWELSLSTGFVLFSLLFKPIVGLVSLWTWYYFQCRLLYWHSSMQEQPIQKLMWSTYGLKWAADSANTEQWQCCCLSSSYICGHVACDWLAACWTRDLQTFYSVLIEPDSKFIGSRTWREEPCTQTILHQRWTRHQRELSILLLHCAQIPLCVLVPQILSILCPSHDCTACWKDYTDKTAEKLRLVSS